jgi:hypothetical protein
MADLKVSVPTRWEQYLKSLGEEHQIDLNAVINELCEWSFSNSEGKKQFEDWLDDAYPLKGKNEDKASDAGAEASMAEEEQEEESDAEVHEHRG